MASLGGGFHFQCGNIYLSQFQIAQYKCKKMVRWWWCQRDEVSPESFNLGKLPINWLRWYQLSQSREGSIDTENESEVTSYESESKVFFSNKKNYQKKHMKVLGSFLVQVAVGIFFPPLESCYDGDMPTASDMLCIHS